LLIALALMLGAARPVQAECNPRKQTKRSVIAVLDSATIRLDDGRVVRLTGVVAPAAPPGLGDGMDWAPAVESHKALEALVAGKSVRIAVSGRRKDRYGRQPAHVFLIDGAREIWVEERLVTLGHARVAADADGGSCTTELLAAEQTARRAKRGLWNHAAYQIRAAAKAHELADFVQSFQIVEGRVREAGERKRRVYLDFGEVWSTDLTAIISGRDRKRFEAAGLDPLQLKGRRLRLRGWVERWNGPLIRLTHPAQIELLDKAAEAETVSPASPSMPISLDPKAKSPD
jgi:endonuclease YncB( thermonuclease family)